MKSSAKAFSWGVSDQALSSLTNFVLAAMVARAVSVRMFGLFSLIFAAYTLVLGLSRAIASDPLLVRFNDVDRSRWRTASASAVGAAFSVGCIAGLCCLVAAAFLSPGPRLVIGTFGLLLPGLVLQDAWRYSFFSRGAGRLAFINDGIWAVVLFASLLIIGTMGYEGELVLLVGAWGLSAAVAGLIGCFQARIVPRPSATRIWMKAHIDLIPKYVGEFVAIIGSVHLSMFGVGAIAGLAAAGSLRAGQVMMGPFNVLFLGLGMVAVPAIGEALRLSRQKVIRTMTSISLLLALAALAWGGAVLLLPRSLGEFILGDSWGGGRSVVFPLAVGWAGTGIATGAVVCLRALGDARRSLYVRAIASSSILLGALIGAAFGGATGAAWTMAVFLWLGSALWWKAARRSLSDRKEMDSRDATLRPEVDETIVPAPTIPD